jgi:hypothetical protein
MSSNTWRIRILADYPGQDAMARIVGGWDGNKAGDTLAEYVYNEVKYSANQQEARDRLQKAQRDLEVMIRELDQRIDLEIDEDPTSNVETPLGEQLDGGGEVET